MQAVCKHPVREIGEEQVGREARVETRIRDRAGIGAGHGCVTACVRFQQPEALMPTARS